MTDEKLIYLVDDDKDFREATCEFLEAEGFPTVAFEQGDAMLAQLDPEWNGIILCDFRMQNMDGLAVLEAARKSAPGVPFVMLTGHGDLRTAIAATRAGAYDFLEKPVQPDYLLSLLRRGLKVRKLAVENSRLRRRVARYSDMRSRLIGTSKAMKACRNELLNVTPLPVTVTLHGEAGTGKELGARTIHEFSELTGEFHTINCATATIDSLRAELERQTDPQDTLFMRSLHQMDAFLQSHLAEFLRQGQRPRVIVSMIGDPDAHMASGVLTRELYYLINVATICLPPLRSRDRDIFILLESFLRTGAARLGKSLPHVDTALIERFRAHDWPGNVRELRNVADRLVIGLPVDLKATARDAGLTMSYDEAMRDFERSLLERTLVETGGHKGDAAAILSIPRKRLYLRLKAVGLSE
ncbi:sigma-54 dependent transcriptional regulator [uncultured Roseovarius sp.]|uniref:sigma-54-dependent transcriptional regulator n=1 Tax=uncultured Roseovarius sp. TaxID=293344 RepID=UPI002596D627|nr:sigma-54 dependent transcriptional regulator [uncultured Roseovarius sp.]